MPVSATASSTQSRPSATLRTRNATSPSFVNLQAPVYLHKGQRHQQHDACKYLLRELAARARAIRHVGLRRAAVDHERPAHGGGDIRGRSNPAAGGIRAAL
jgi:hypothetical protein